MGRTRLLRLIAVGVCVAATGCYSKFATQATHPDGHIALPVDRVWPTVVSEIQSRYAIAAIDEGNRCLTTHVFPVEVGRENLYMGRYVLRPRPWPTFAMWHGLRARLAIRIVANGTDASVVAITACYEAFEDNVIGGWVPVESNGCLEQETLQIIRQRLDPM
jgi:hypothetical protein